ncbi:MAG TPA: dihydrolipoamide acetyltransferase family protein [Stellaceae bacterium]|nr:dihydrolipoamide acetyltransferase family protein [Stellaceae bacterium]
MGQYVIKMPDLGEGGTEAEIVAWHVKVGDTIREEDPLVDIMTDKATVEIPAPATGKVVALNGAPGERRPVGSELAMLEVAGEGNVAAGAASRPSPTARSASSPPSPAMREREKKGDAEVIPLSRIAGEGGETRRTEPGEDSRPVLPRRGGGKPLASPAVRKRAVDLGIELRFVPGSGPAGRITQDDLDAYAAGQSQPAPTSGGLARRDGVEDVPITGLRRIIAERLQLSKRQIPHFSYIEEVDVTALEELRTHLNAEAGERPHLTVMPFLMRAIARAVVEHPQVNARFDGQKGVLHRHAAVHIGVATQTEGGLMVPVAHHAEALDLWQAAAEVARLAEAARAGRATREELTGSTITVTSLGALGGIAATPVINYPEVAIVGVNRIVERPVVRDGQVVVRKMINLSSSFDHRIVDGWEAASFIQRVKAYLEQPATLFIG